MIDNNFYLPFKLYSSDDEVNIKDENSNNYPKFFTISSNYNNGSDTNNCLNINRYNSTVKNLVQDVYERLENTSIIVDNFFPLNFIIYFPSDNVNQLNYNYSQ